MAKPWYETVLDTLDFGEIPKAAGVNLEMESRWVVNVLGELMQQVMPTVGVSRPREIAPCEVGRCLGQLCANIYAIGEALPKVSVLSQEQGDALKKEFKKNRHIPTVDMALRATEVCAHSLEALRAVAEPFEAAVQEAFKAALAQPDYAEAAAFFKGFAKGMSKQGLTTKARPVGATTATPIYQRLFSEREKIKTLKSVRELREFLLERGLSEQVLGNPKRLEKICQRIGLSFAEPGRPKCAK